jgi:hypothetical protein
MENEDWYEELRELNKGDLVGIIQTNGKMSGPYIFEYIEDNYVEIDYYSGSEVYLRDKAGKLYSISASFVVPWDDAPINAALRNVFQKGYSKGPINADVGPANIVRKFLGMKTRSSANSKKQRRKKSRRTRRRV